MTCSRPKSQEIDTAPHFSVLCYLPSAASASCSWEKGLYFVFIGISAPNSPLLPAPVSRWCKKCQAGTYAMQEPEKAFFHEVKDNSSLLACRWASGCILPPCSALGVAGLGWKRLSGTQRRELGVPPWPSTNAASGTRAQHSPESESKGHGRAEKRPAPSPGGL